ncbi:sigma-54-dependent transcriptional regulator [Aureimonas altamirensis]|uniref:Two-component system, NtrC family, nitrogen regulation response regulator NtrX n=1 Tax=Aureimonas altamirensis DSM 21988 TaxID=1121026 RepID=A0ABY1I9Q6_9HYPH|nr:sigma-54 dependent transcriptional regulator [Aureimonas altamirensis]UHD44321.1 sigma-54 dependent transcriptional regulator [Aureimonas altamirensis]SHI73031.1 two-component system, NtrC family, nitrogen regulation response regulator NtrX [Aureimonas altamirensis DSM 21988]
MASDILIVDDEADIRDLVAGILEDEGHETRIAGNSDAALAAIADRVPRLIFLDIWLQGSRLDGLDLLEAIKTQHPEIPVVMISGHGNIETAVSAIKRGAYDYIEKPFKADRLVLIAERALETSKLKREVLELRRRTYDSPELIGKSHVMNQLRTTIERVAPTNSRVMILGPSGSGKEMVARAIHAASARSGGPFVALNAATITPERMEVELFGTDTPPGVERKVGAFEEAHGGVLYLDEVGDMPRETQNKILRVLTEQTFERVGGTKKVKVDVRIISSTAQNLESLMSEGAFREDLYHRLAVVPISVPPLAERRADIPLLIDAFMRQISDQTGIRPKELSPEALAVLQSSDWPGNIRQLRNNIERLMILSRQDDNEVISADMLPHEVSEMLPRTPSQSDGRILALPLRDAREVFEKEYLVAQINRFGGNISRTAEFVGMERSALHRKLKSLGI